MSPLNSSVDTDRSVDNTNGINHLENINKQPKIVTLAFSSDSDSEESDSQEEINRVLYY